MPDYLQFRQSYRNSLMHSPKGTTWKVHKYIKKIAGKYFYKDDDIEETDKEELLKKERELDDRKSQLQSDLYQEILNAMKDYENSSYFNKDAPTSVYFDKDNPGSKKMVEANMKKALSGGFEGYANGTMRKINRLVTEYKKVEEDLAELNERKEKEIKHCLDIGVSAIKDVFHSSKGSTWEEHKYIKRIDGTYYYPDSYEGGRHLPDGEDKTSDSKDFSEEIKREKLDLGSDDIETLAQEVIRGNFGNGQERKDLLGENYQEIQDRVNQILRRSNVSNQKISSVSQEIVKTGEKAINETIKRKETKTPVKKGINLDRVYNVYRKR